MDNTRRLIETLNTKQKSNQESGPLVKDQQPVESMQIQIEQLKKENEYLKSSSQKIQEDKGKTT